ASRLCAVGRGSENRLAAGFCRLHRRRGTALDGDCERDRHQGRLSAAGSLEKIMLGKRIVCSAILMLACSLGAAGCMSSEHFGQLAWQFKRMSGSSGLKVQAAIAC